MLRFRRQIPLWLPIFIIA
uniref:Uncharacterized protein n=1 Tax=Arundo donax TaxID=35708 RepID=A0A0A9ECW2_ARUDO